MYWPAVNGVGSPSKRTQNVASEGLASSRLMSEALYCGASGRIARWSVSSISGMVPARVVPPSGPFGRLRRSTRQPVRVATPCAGTIRGPMTQTIAPATADRTHKAAKRYMYAWGEGSAVGNGGMKDLLGGKGAGLAEMSSSGLPTPPGFMITTAACHDYFATGEKLPDG